MSNKNIFNIDDATLCGYRVGSIAPKEFGNEHYQNFEEGYAVYVLENRISAIFVCFRPGYREFESFTGETVANREVWQVDEYTTREDVEDVLGRPTKTWNDGVEISARHTGLGKVVHVIWKTARGPTLDYISIEPTTS